MNIRDFIKRHNLLLALSEYRSSEPLFLVGGTVRDILLERPLLDIDIVFLHFEEKFIRFVADLLGTSSIKKSEFLTWKIKGKSIEVDIAHARGEIYRRPGALPETYPVYSIEEDLKRRDFTINSIACFLTQRTGEIVDPYGGVDDFKKGIVRVLKAGSFTEDPTRAFRAIRYRNRFKFIYDNLTETEFENARIHMAKLSASRIRNELLKISVEENRFNMFLEVEERGLLRSWRREFSDFDKGILQRLDGYLGFEKSKWFYFLLAFSRDFEFLSNIGLLRKEEKRKLRKVLGCRADHKDLTLDSLHPQLREYEEDEILAWGALKDVPLTVLLNYIRKRNEKPELKPRELLEMGVPQNSLKSILIQLELARMKGELKDKDAEIGYIRKILSRHTSLP